MDSCIRSSLQLIQRKSRSGLPIIYLTIGRTILCFQVFWNPLGVCNYSYPTLIFTLFVAGNDFRLLPPQCGTLVYGFWLWFVVINGVVSQTSNVPSAASFLEDHPGAYTTSRTHNKASCILFWERHLRRLADSVRILAESKPDYLYGSDKTRISPFSLSSPSSSLESMIRPVVFNSLRNVLPIALKDRRIEEELVITTIVSGNSNNLENYDEDRDKTRDFDVYLHIDVYVPPVFGVRENSAHLAVVGPGRDTANAKFSDWVRIRKSLEKLRPPLANELLLSNDGDHILEGCATNFFVVCRKERSDAQVECSSDLDKEYSYEVQTASISDGVLPGIIRQLFIDVCLTLGIPLREVAPSWSEHELWEEAFITNSLKLMQHVETIRVPSSWDQLELKTWEEVSWREKRFKEGPGVITAMIQREVMRKASLEGYPITDCI